MNETARQGRGGNDGMREGQSSSQFEPSQAAATITTLGMTKAREAEGQQAKGKQCD